MSRAVEPHLAAAKVIAAGPLGNDSLRATIMLTPLYSGSARLLSHWPSQTINWLRQNHFRLSLLVQSVSYASDKECVALPQGEISSLDAQVSAMEAIWKGTSDVAWVDELWVRAFDATKDPNTWSLLAEQIRRSSTGGTLSTGTTGMSGAASVPNGTNGGGLSKTKVAGNDENVTLDWILPNRQAELSLMLEYKRALELCDSAVHAFDKQQDTMSKEIDCCKIAQNPPDASLEGLFDATRTQYKLSHARVENFYLGKPCGPQNSKANVAGHPAWLAGAERTDIEQALHGPLDLYQAANQPQRYAEGGKNPSTTTDDLIQVFYSLQSSPTLSRLFGLTLDVRFPDNGLRELLHSEPNSDGSYFLYLALKDGSLCGSPLGCSIYTLAKYRPSSSQRHFWPVTRSEVAMGRSPNSESLFELDQFDGVMLAGKKLSTPMGEVSRFELSSLDVRSACEAALDRRCATLSKVEQDKCASGNSVQRPSAIARKTYMTAGLVILDRGRQDQAISQFAARSAHQPGKGSSIVLDAEDLTIGYRLDVGVPLKGEKPSFAWRGLMARNMKYGITGIHGDRVRAVAGRLFVESDHGKSGDADDNWRQCLEDGFLALTARLIPRTDDANGSTDAYVEEAIASWHGEPMSVPCAGKRQDKVKPLYGLPSGCVVTAPTKRKDPQRRPPALRFGYPYRVGLRPVYSGGLSLPLEVAATLYDLDRKAEFPLGGSLTIPAAQGNNLRRRDQLRRFLRHERINAPFLLMPEAVAVRRNGPMENDRAAHAIIRTVGGSVRIGSIR